MAVKFEKKTKPAKAEVAATKQVVTDSTDVSTEVIDEFLTLHREIAAAEQKFKDKYLTKNKRVAELRLDITRTATAELPPESSIELMGSGTLGGIEISKQSESTTIVDMPKIRELLGDDLFFALAKVNLSDLNDYMTKPQLMLVTKTERTGPRRFKVV